MQFFYQGGYQVIATLISNYFLPEFPSVIYEKYTNHLLNQLLTSMQLHTGHFVISGFHNYHLQHAAILVLYTVVVALEKNYDGKKGNRAG